MLHSAAPSSFNMFPFGHSSQHSNPAPIPQHGDMFHNPHHHHHHQHHPNPSQQTEAPPKPRFLFKMPRVVPNQKEKFESDEFLKRHSREGEVKKARCYFILQSNVCRFYQTCFLATQTLRNCCFFPNRKKIFRLHRISTLYRVGWRQNVLLIIGTGFGVG